MGKILSTFLSPHPPIVMSEVGKGSEEDAEKTIQALNEMADMIKAQSPTTIIVITPHGPVFQDAIAIGYEEVLKGNMRRFGSYELDFEKQNNLKLVKDIIARADSEGIYCLKLDGASAASYRIDKSIDHGVQVPLYFVDKKYKDYKLVHITYAMLTYEDLYKFGMIVRDAVEASDENAVVIASGDLSHRLSDSGPYEYDPAGPEFDNQIIEILKAAEFEKIAEMDRSMVRSAGECGLRSIEVMAGTLDGHEVDAKLLSYEGPFGVGYGVMQFVAGEESEDRKLLDRISGRVDKKRSEAKEKEDEYVRLARKSLESYILNRRKIGIPDNLPKEMLSKRAGVFVSIKKHGNLRGCIGTIAPTTGNIAEEIIENAINAGVGDPRFNQIRADEIDDLEYSVDVLGEAELIRSLDELDPKKYGVIVTKGFRRGLLLPNLEGVDTVEEQIGIALRKAGISDDEDYSIEKFEVTRHK